jgi:hypothetical protein
VVNKEYCLIQVPNWPVPGTEMSRSVPKCPGPSTEMSKSVPRCPGPEMWLVVLLLGCRCRLSVNTICGRIMIGLSLSSVSKHNMWSCYDWVFVVVVRQLTQYVIVLWLGCRCCRPSVNTICGRIMIGLSLSSVSKHNMWSYYDWVVVVVVRQ